MDALTVAVPTGRLFDETIDLLRRLSLVDGAPPERSLVLHGRDGVRLVVAKPIDIPTYVELGAADAGIAGKDVLLEQSRDVYELVDLGFGACRGVVALPMPAAGLWRPGRWLRIATKYPKVTARFFETQRRPVELIELHGAVELAPRVGLADGIMDLVVSGRTLRDNLLVEVAEVFRSSARLIVNRASLRTKAGRLRPLLDALAAPAS